MAIDISAFLPRDNSSFLYNATSGIGQTIAQNRNAAERQAIANQELDLRRRSLDIQQNQIDRQLKIDEAATNALAGLQFGFPAPAAPAARADATPVPSLPTFARDLSGAMNQAAAKYNLDPRYLPVTAAIESGGDPAARNKSGATGLFQFMPSTARDYGVDPTNPLSSIEGAARYAADAKQYLTQALGREPTPGELYLAHQQGPKGAAVLLSQPDAPAAALVGRAAVAQNGGSPTMTAAQFASLWTSKFDRLASSLAEPQGSPQAGVQVAGDVPAGAYLVAAQQARDAAGALPQAPALPPVPPQQMDPFARVPPQLKAALPALLRSPAMRPIAETLLKPYLPRDRQLQLVDGPNGKVLMDTATGQFYDAGLGVDQGRQLDIEGKRLSNAKVARELEGEGAIPLTVDERNLFNIPAGQAAYKTREGAIKFGPAGMNVNIDQKQEGEFGKETGKALAKRFNDLAEDGDAAVRDLQALGELRTLGGKFQTGGSAALQGWLAERGIKIGDTAPIEAYSSLIDKLTPAQRIPGTGATSDFDAKMFKNSLPQIINSPGGNDFIVNTLERMAQNRTARGDIAMRVQMGELTPKEGLVELRKLQAEAKAQSDAVVARAKGQAKATAGAPAIGAIEDGYRFKGGDPASPSSWEKVN